MEPAIVVAKVLLTLRRKTFAIVKLYGIARRRFAKGSNAFGFWPLKIRLLLVSESGMNEKPRGFPRNMRTES